MPRKLSRIAPDWWDYTTLEDDLIQEAARLTVDDLGATRAARIRSDVLRHVGRVLSRRGA
ncbi:MAG: hypothetical protein QM811_16290 [Pirellulales bacterium]